jgi:hypothetical protein
MSTDITFRGQSTPAMFVDAAGCVLCNEVGFIQIAKLRADLTMGGLFSGVPVLAQDYWMNRDWFVDGGIPYKGHSIDPSKTIGQLVTGHEVSMTDIPNVSTFYLGVFGSYVHYYEQSSEVHLVCLEGLEKGATYGGVYWGHSFRIKPGEFFGDSIDKYNVRRWAIKTDRPSDEFRKLVGPRLFPAPQIIITPGF